MEPNLFQTSLTVVERNLRQLPPLESFDEAHALDRAEHTGFYTAAFVMQVWISEQIAQAEHQFADVSQPELRLFQQGHPWQRLQELFQRYHWSGPGFHAVLAAVLPPVHLAPCPSPAALSAYCIHTVSLSSPKLSLDTRERPEPRALNIARRLSRPLEGI